MPDSLAEWVWWFSTSIILSIPISIIGNMLTPPVERQLANYSKFFQKRTANQSEKYKETVHLMKKDMRFYLHVMNQVNLLYQALANILIVTMLAIVVWTFTDSVYFQTIAIFCGVYGNYMSYEICKTSLDASAAYSEYWQKHKFEESSE